MEVFEGVQETMLIPLVIKANETKRKNARIQDNMAVQMIEKMDIPTGKYDKFMSHEGVVARTILFDSAVIHFVQKYPDAVCVCIGCGFDARFERVDNGKITWYDLDFPQVIQAREKYFPQKERVHMIACSALDPAWTQQIPKKKHTIFIIEGILMYFTKEEVVKLLHIIKENFGQCILITELMPPFTSKMSKHHDTLKNTNAVFRWGVKSAKEVTALCDGLTVLSEKSFNVEMKKYTLRGWLFATLPGIKNCNNRIAIFRLK